MGPRALLDGCGKFHTYRDSIPVPSSPRRVSVHSVTFKNSQIDLFSVLKYESHRQTRDETLQSGLQPIAMSVPTQQHRKLASKPPETIQLTGAVLEQRQSCRQSSMLPEGYMEAVPLKDAFCFMQYCHGTR